MRAGALWQPALPLLVLVAISDYSNALLSDGIPLLQREGRPGLISDLRTTWNGLLGYSAATLLQARETNVTSSNVGGSQSGRMQCTISRSLSRPGPVLGSPGSTGTTGDTGNTTVTGTGKGPTPTGGLTIPSAIPPNEFPPSIWNLVNEHSGSSFFDDWDFFTGSDPTHGNVQYVDENTARSMQLVTVNDNGTVIMKVDTTPKLSTPFRSSVRITTKYQYTGGLLVLDAWHAPTGCATWPAFWSNGPNWPNNGEIDIMEGVNDLSTNQASVHTTTGCSISSNQTMNNATGTLVGPPDCASFETNNSGCGVQATSQQNTYGKGFNAIGGGVYAMVWEDSGISIFFFPRNSIPQDLLVKKPQPDTWGIPFARYPSTSCNPFQFFKSHSAIFDTTLCGDWAGNAWNQAGVPGQEDSCATRTGFATCADFVQNSGASFETAYWEVASVRLYQKNN